MMMSGLPSVALKPSLPAWPITSMRRPAPAETAPRMATPLPPPADMFPAAKPVSVRRPSRFAPWPSMRTSRSPATVASSMTTAVLAPTAAPPMLEVQVGPWPLMPMSPTDFSTAPLPMATPLRP
ncbi:hypothetical protein D3C72_1584690 [compost metagenome]